MKIIIRNGSLVFENKEYTTQVLSEDIVTRGTYVDWVKGKLKSNANYSYSGLFPYKGGYIAATHLPRQNYGKAVICFYTDNGETYIQFGNGAPTTTENGLADYVTETYSSEDCNYLIPEEDIRALGDIKYFRIGCIGNGQIGISTVKYKV